MWGLNPANIDIHQIQNLNSYLRQIIDFEKNQKYLCEMQELQQKQFEISQPVFSSRFLQNDNLLQYDYEISQAAHWIVNETALSLEAGLLSFSTCINAATRGTCYIKIKDGWLEPSIIYSSIYANSGARKSVVADRLQKPFRTIEDNIHKKLNSEQDKLLNTILQCKRKDIINNMDIDDVSSVTKALSDINDYTEQIKQVTGDVEGFNQIMTRFPANYRSHEIWQKGPW